MEFLRPEALSKDVKNQGIELRKIHNYSIRKAASTLGISAGYLSKIITIYEGMQEFPANLTSALPVIAAC